MTKKLPDLLYLTLLHQDFDEVMLQYSKDKKYKLLKELLPIKQDYFPFSLFIYAADTLNIKLIKILTSCVKISCTKLLVQKTRELIDYISLKPNHHFLQESKESVENSTILDRKIYIASFLIDYYFSKKEELLKRGKNSYVDLESEKYFIKLYAILHYPNATNAFIEKHNIKIEMFGEIDFPFRFIEKATPITKTNEDKNSFLSISFSINDEYNVAIEKAYKNLRECPTTGKIIEFVEYQIQHGNVLKLLFNSTISYYNQYLNHVAINFSPNKGFIIESLMAHELSHFLMFCLYNNECYPYKSFLEKPTTSTAFTTKKEEREKGISRIEAYHKSNFKILNLARDLLLPDIPTPEIQSLDEYIEYLKEKTIIILYALNYEYQMGIANEARINQALKKDLILVINNLLDIENMSNLIIIEELIDRNGDITIKYLIEDVLPQVNKFYKLSDSDIFFLTRIADIAIRNQLERDVEYVVRFPEFVIMDYMGLIDDPRIMDSFEDLKTYWEEEILKQISVQNIDAQQNEFMDSC